MGTISYPGWLVTQALLEPHPALKAASEQASPDDMFINDDFHHNGAFRLTYGFEYSALLETSKQAIYAALEQTDTEHINFFVAATWNHGGWMGDSGRKLGDIDWGSDISRYYRSEILAPWFAHWLHDNH